MPKAEKIPQTKRKYHLKNKNPKRGFSKFKVWAEDTEYNDKTLRKLNALLNESRLKDQ